MVEHISTLGYGFGCFAQIWSKHLKPKSLRYVLVSREWRIAPSQGLSVDSVTYHREYVDILVHSYPDWDSNPPECSSLQHPVTSSISDPNLFLSSYTS
jgi:hypothetical protein